MNTELLFLYRQAHGMQPSAAVSELMFTAWLNAMIDLYQRTYNVRPSVTQKWVDPLFLLYSKTLVRNAVGNTRRTAGQNLLFETV